MRRCAGCGFVDYARHDGCPVCGGRDWRVMDVGPRLRDVFLYIRVCSPALVDDLFDRRRCLGLLADYGIGDRGSLWLVGQAFDAQAVGLLSSSRDGSGLRKMGHRLRDRHMVRLDEADVEALVDAYRVLLGLDADGRQNSQTATPAPAATVVQADAAATPEECFERGDEYYRKRDYVQAFHWYMKAAQQGHANAQKIIGFMYENGVGVDMDAVQAFHWFMKAAEQGDPAAQTKIGFMYRIGEGVGKDAVQAFHWFMKAAEQGDFLAQKIIGVMYENGEGVDKDLAQAEFWYLKAFAHGYGHIQHELDRLRQR